MVSLLLLLAVTCVPAIEREKREWAINLKCYVRCAHNGNKDSPLSLTGTLPVHSNGFLIIFRVICVRLFTLSTVFLLVDRQEEENFNFVFG